MNTPTKIIKTPIGEIEIELRQWITGRQAEYIQEPLFGAMRVSNIQVGPDGKPQSTNSVDAKTAVQETGHREIESFTVRVGTETDQKKCLELILDMRESDYNFVQEEIRKIKEESKKK